MAATILSRDDRPITAHQVAERTPSQWLPGLVVKLIGQHREDVDRWRAEHRGWRIAADGLAAAFAQARTRTRTRDRSSGLEL